MINKNPVSWQTKEGYPSFSSEELAEIVFSGDEIGGPWIVENWRWLPFQQASRQGADAWIIGNTMVAFVGGAKHCHDYMTFRHTVACCTKNLLLSSAERMDEAARPFPRELQRNAPHGATNGPRHF